MDQPISICWFRRDLRTHDHAALYHALKAGLPVLPLFIFDQSILDKLEDKSDKRVHFIHEQILKLKKEFRNQQSDILVEYGHPLEIWKKLIQQYPIKKVFTNHDYEPYAKERDQHIQSILNKNNIAFLSFKDQCIFEKDEVVKDDGKPYTVFTPYSKKWKAKLNSFYYKSYPTEKHFSNLLHTQLQTEVPTLESMGFKTTHDSFPSEVVPIDIIKNYDKQRDFPAMNGTSRLGIHLRFGTISIREKVKMALSMNETFLNELIWRDFYMQILWHFPHVASGAFKPAYDRIVWRNNEIEFKAWCEGKTGYPIVDAGMRELNATGFMHNRVRMIVASFLTKHLLIDWRWGEAYFAQKLLDFDLSANNGGWQWAAGSGTDAAPYFRVFNPALQTEKFDKQLLYIKKWVPELNELTYPRPIVNHDFARKRCLETYKVALSN